MNKLGIIGAMTLEVETLLGKMENTTVHTYAGSEFHEGTLEGLPVVVCQSGIGKVNAALCTQILCDRFEVTHLVNTGVAGSLCSELDIGDLVISQDAMYHDFDCVYFGYPYALVPGMDVVAFPADETLMAYAFSAADAVHPGHVRVGRVASGDQFIGEQSKKDFVISKTQALCTEMEGAAIAQTAYRNKLPFVIVRAISDKADDAATVDNLTFERETAHHCAHVTCQLAKNLAEADAL